MTIPYDMGPDCHPSGRPFRNLVPRLRPPRLIYGTYLTPTQTIPFDAPERPPDGPPPLVSASWQALASRLAARHRADMERRQYFERLAVASPLNIASRWPWA